MSVHAISLVRPALQYHRLHWQQLVFLNKKKFHPRLTFSPGAFFGTGGKTATKMSKAGGRGGKAKSTVQPLQPARERDESASDESVQVVSPPSVTLRSPPPVPRMVYDNQPNRVGSKPGYDQPLGRFLPSPNKTFFNKRAQLEFDDLHTCQHMSPVTLVRRDVQ